MADATWLNQNCLMQHVEELRVAREETVTAESKAMQLLSDTSSLQAKEQELMSSLAGLQSRHDQCQATQVGQPPHATHRGEQMAK